MDKKQLEALVIFAIFMQNGEGILSKAPRYIEEKYNYCLNGGKGLDMTNQHILKKYKEKWGFDECNED